MHRRIIPSTLIMALLFTLGACSSKKEEKKEVAGYTPNPKVIEFLRSGLEFKLGDSVAEIKQNLGPPSSEKVVRVQSKPGGAVEETHTLEYPGLSVEVDRLGENKPRDILMRLTLTDGKYKTRMSLTIGTSQSEVKRILGEPWGVENEAMVYEEDIGDVVFYLRDGVVRKIQWDWYPD